MAFVILLGVAAEKTLNCLLKGKGNEMSMEHGRIERGTQQLEFCTEYSTRLMLFPYACLSASNGRKREALLQLVH